MTRIVLDVATAPIADVADYLDGDDLIPPSNYKDLDKIADWIAKAKARALEMAACDFDLCRITAIGVHLSGFDVQSDPDICRDEDDERAALANYLPLLTSAETQIVTFGGFAFDLPVILRRCMHLGLPVPNLNLDRYRTPHVDLYERLTLNGKVKAHALGWYVKRLGWTDLVKPLSGAEESRVPETGRWDKLAASVWHDLIATRRLGEWMGVIPPEVEDVSELDRINQTESTRRHA